MCWQNDRANQLKNLAKLSAIIAGFSMSSFLEFNFDPNTVPSGLLIAYGLTTAAVVSVAWKIKRCEGWIDAYHMHWSLCLE